MFSNKIAQKTLLTVMLTGLTQVSYAAAYVISTPAELNTAITTTNGDADSTATLSANLTLTGAVTPLTGFNFDMSGGTVRTINMGTFGSFSAAATKTLTLGHILAGSSGFTATGGGTVIINQANTYTGGTTVSGGTTLQVQTASSIGGGDITLNGGSTLKLGSAGVTIDNTRNIILGAAGTLDANAQALTVAGVISGAFGLTLAGGGTATLTGTNTYTGGTTLTGGTTAVINSDSSLGTGNITVTNGHLQSTATLSTTKTMALSAATNITTNASTTLTLGGAISDVGGARALAKLGTGTLVLSANSTAHTGTTTVTAGTLVLGAGGTTGSVGAGGNGNIVNNSALQINRSDDFTYTGVISGTGTLSKISTNALTLSAAQTFSGATAVTAGTLFINNNFASAVTVGSGAIVGGTGTLGAAGTALSVGSGATVAPGTAGATGTLTVTNNATFAGGGKYVAQVAAGGANDVLAVGGTVTLTDGILYIAKTAAESTYTAGAHNYDVLTYTAKTGVFDTSLIQSDFAYLTPTVTYVGGNTVRVVLNTKTMDYGTSVGTTANQKAIGASIDATAGSTDTTMLGLVVSLNNLTAEQKVLALDSLSGKTHTDTAGMQATHGASFAKGMTSQGTAFGSGFSGRFRPLALSGLVQYLNDSHVEESYRLAEQEVWITSPYTTTRATTDGNAAGYQADTRGIQAGFGRKITARHLVGLGASYDKSNITFDNHVQTGSVRSMQAALYGKAEMGQYHFSGTVAGSHQRYSTTRQITIGGLSTPAYASFDGAGASVYAEGFMRHCWRGVTVEPVLGLLAQGIWQDSFTETSAAAGALTVASYFKSRVESTLGARFRSTFNRKLTGELRAFWRHDWTDPVSTMTARLAIPGSVSFSGRGLAASRNGYTVGAGLAARLNDHWKGLADYNADWRPKQGGSKSVSNAVSIGLKGEW